MRSEMQMCSIPFTASFRSGETQGRTVQPLSNFDPIPSFQFVIFAFAKI